MSDSCLLPVTRSVSNERWLHRLSALLGGCAAATMLLLVGQPTFAALSFSGDVKLTTGDRGAASIGSVSIGSIRLDNGSSFSSSTTTFGGSATGIGTGVVSGPRTYWNMGNVDVGMSGIGRLVSLRSPRTLPREGRPSRRFARQGTRPRRRTGPNHAFWRRSAMTCVNR